VTAEPPAGPALWSVNKTRRWCLVLTTIAQGTPLLRHSGSQGPIGAPAQARTRAGRVACRILASDELNAKARGPRDRLPSWTTTSNPSLSRECCSSPTIRKSAAPPLSNATACTANEPRCRCPGSCSARPLSDSSGHRPSLLPRESSPSCGCGRVASVAESRALGSGARSPSVHTRLTDCGCRSASGQPRWSLCSVLVVASGVGW
jgi:hypothetical protein